MKGDGILPVIEDVVISLGPDVPEAKREDHIPRKKIVVRLILGFVPHLDPVGIGQIDSYESLIRDVIVVDSRPERFCIVTMEEDIVNVLSGVTAEGAIEVDIQINVMEILGGRKPTMMQKPKKDSDFVGTVDFPNPFKVFTAVLGERERVMNQGVSTFNNDGKIPNESIIFITVGIEIDSVNASLQLIGNND